MKPRYSHLSESDPGRDGPDSALAVRVGERVGWYLARPTDSFRAGAHTLNEPEGTMSLWMLSLEDLSTVSDQPHIGRSEPSYQIYGLIADQENRRAWESAGFAFFWSSQWYPQLVAKFYRGNIYMDAYRPIDKALVTVGHLSLRKMEWLHVAVTWSRQRGDFRIYLNGVLAGVGNRFGHLVSETCGDDLFVGNTAIALADLQFHDQQLDPRQIEALASHGETNALTWSDAGMFTGRTLQRVDWEHEHGWDLRLEDSLCEGTVEEKFVEQGCPGAMAITAEGARITTSKIHPLDMDRPSDWPESEPFDLAQVYYWTNQYFEGDIGLEFEFKSLQEFGLLLILIQSAGMQREDFLTNHTKRISGAMRTVCWENVRNYHWELYRQMGDCRNDVASHVLVKNPWLRPLGYQCMDRRLSVNAWHRVRFVQDGGRLRAAVNDLIVIDAFDDPGAGHGPVFQCGRLGIRCMYDTDIVIRNLRVWTKSGRNETSQQ